MLDELAKLAHLMADEAGMIARHYYRSGGLDVVTKSDMTPVTQADREIEQRLRALVNEFRPEDGIIGEEFGTIASKSGYTWVFDPIDGTKSFTIGRPTFGTLIGLCKDGKPVLGVIDQPVLKERWIGVEGRPTFFNQSGVRTRACKDLGRGILGTGSASQIGRTDSGRCLRLEQSVGYMVYQGDCYFYGLLANGWMDAIVEDQLGIYDYIALIPVIEGAGGKITDWHGQPLTLESDGSLACTGDASQHDHLLALISV